MQDTDYDIPNSSTGRQCRTLKRHDKHCGIYPTNTETKCLERVASQVRKVDPCAASEELRAYATLDVLRHAIRDCNPDDISFLSGNRMSNGKWMPRRLLPSQKLGN